MAGIQSYVLVIFLLLHFTRLDGSNLILERDIKIDRILHQVFGFTSLRGHQKRVISEVLDGKDAFAVMPTGAGKSLCYQLPAVYAESKVTLVVTPLLALMLGQVKSLQSKGVLASAIYSSQSKRDRERVINDLLGKPSPDSEPLTFPPMMRLLYVTPELLCTSNFQQDLSILYDGGYINLIAIDEAHCVSEWGHEFRPCFRKLGSIHQRFPSVPWLALTATATEQVRRDVVNILKIKVDKIFMQSFDRPNIRYQVRYKDLIGEDEQVFEDIASFVAGLQYACSGIIYCHTKASCDALAQQLSAIGVKAKAYHAGLRPRERMQVQDEWMEGVTKVVCATIAFGMGIDKKDVRFVIHQSMPKSLEAYYQETGRAGRDGGESEALMYFSEDDANLHRFLLRKSVENQEVQPERVKAVLHNLEQMAFFCRGSKTFGTKRQAYFASMREETSEDSWDGASDEDFKLEVVNARMLGGGMECRRLQILRHFGEAFNRSMLTRNLSRCCDVCVNPNFTRRADLDYMKMMQTGFQYPLYYERKGVGGGGRLTLKRLGRLDQFNLTDQEDEKPAFAKASDLVQEVITPPPEVEVCASSVTQDSEHNRSQSMQPAAEEEEEEEEEAAPNTDKERRKKRQAESKQEKGCKQKKNKLAPGQTLMTAWIQGSRELP